MRCFNESVAPLSSHWGVRPLERLGEPRVGERLVPVKAVPLKYTGRVGLFPASVRHLLPFCLLLFICHSSAVIPESTCFLASISSKPKSYSWGDVHFQTWWTWAYTWRGTAWNHLCTLLGSSGIYKVELLVGVRTNGFVDRIFFSSYREFVFWSYGLFHTPFDATFYKWDHRCCSVAFLFPRDRERRHSERAWGSELNDIERGLSIQDISWSFLSGGAPGWSYYEEDLGHTWRRPWALQKHNVPRLAWKHLRITQEELKEVCVDGESWTTAHSAEPTTLPQIHALLHVQ